MTSAKILIVDDEVEFASVLAERLQLRGYDAKAVYCAEDSFAIAKSDPPDVILLDLKMPGMSGIEILMTMICWLQKSKKHLWKRLKGQ
ncbi:MAG: response regulator [Nitrospirae bacterium]|nr:response regulator [Nitrospirota bacterium]